MHQDLLGQICSEARSIPDGALPTYIPALGHVDPEGLALCTVHPSGRLEGAGDCDIVFTIQSVSKPLLYGLALGIRGRDAVRRVVGTSPTHLPFNALGLERGSRRVLNPMLNSGTLLVLDLIMGDAGLGQAMGQILDCLGAFTGGRPEIDTEVFESELRHAERNRALAHRLKARGLLRNAAEEVVRLHCMQSSLRVTTRDLAVLAGTLACFGRNPVTRAQAVEPELARDMLLVMATSGMYGSTGDWTDQVGIPAKSGVSGGIIAAAPGRLGIAAYSPRLDPCGHSVRGWAACRMLSRHLALHFLGR